MRVRRILCALGVASATLSLGGVAWGYWTATGGGSGQATVAATAPTLSLHATVAGLLLPGTSVPVSFTADNPSATDLRVGTIHLDSVTADRDGCQPADFQMADVLVQQTVPARHRDFPLEGTGELFYADTPLDQSACIGARLTLTISSG
ncbi:MAG TPA: hypothetical protein VHO01_01315 [Jatrophihabitans sp.]|nr:hypothetical protein [Jatrophihabitans sp.]